MRRFLLASKLKRTGFTCPMVMGTLVPLLSFWSAKALFSISTMLLFLRSTSSFADSA